MADPNSNLPEWLKAAISPGGAPLSLREALATRVKGIELTQDSLSLAPNGAVGDRATVRIRLTAPNDAAVLYSLTVEAVPEQIGLALVNGIYNLTPFGAQLTNGMTLTRQWLRRNLVDPQSLMLFGNKAGMELRFVNLSYYTGVVRVMAQYGVMDRADANALLQTYQQQIVAG
ncbi:MAG: hypothetical protein NTZ05_12390 [Chloroflexi bacterium]|nr:hypothetical protein [Chloroflexota bacterium]